MRCLKVLFIVIAITSNVYAASYPEKVLVSEVKGKIRAEKIPMQGIIYFERVSGISTEVGL